MARPEVEDIARLRFFAAGIYELFRHRDQFADDIRRYQAFDAHVAVLEIVFALRLAQHARGMREDVLGLHGRSP